MNEILRYMQKRDKRTDARTHTKARTDTHMEGVLYSPDHGLWLQAGDNKRRKLDLNYQDRELDLNYQP